jgi:hypothetical protein
MEDGKGSVAQTALSACEADVRLSPISNRQGVENARRSRVRKPAISRFRIGRSLRYTIGCEITGLNSMLHFP